MILELKEDRETYLVDRNLWGELPGELIPKVLFTVINRQGVLTLWPIRLPGEDGRHDEWNRSALEAAEMAQKEWIRVAANMSLGAYEVYRAMAIFRNRNGRITPSRKSCGWPLGTGSSTPSTIP